MSFFAILFHIRLISLCLCHLNEELTLTSIKEPNKSSECFHRPPADCPPPSEACRCTTISTTSAVCCNVDQFRLDCFSARMTKVSELHIRNATLDVLNVTGAMWRQLKSLAITDGYIKKVVGEFDKLATISCLNMSSNSISVFEDRSLMKIDNLSIVDLSNNDLSDIPRFKNIGVMTLDVSGNKPLLCSHLSDAVRRNKLQFKNEDLTTCLNFRTIASWFNSTDPVTLKDLLRLHEPECIGNCTCKPYRTQILPGKLESFSLMVTCFGLQLPSLPPMLPPNTVFLNVSNNNISSLDIMKDESSYQDLRYLYADDNEITSILPLEGTNFIRNFEVLSLRNNKLKLLPKYILSNAFDTNYNFKYVNLGLNRLQCDCDAARVLKEWLLEKQQDILDYNEIYCNNMDSRVVDLDASKLCQNQQDEDGTDYIYYIITFEILLLVSLITKVSYDYWVLKTTGYLPWPASHMPKLPCDWFWE